MSIIKSISGIRGTIGGKPGDGLGAVDIVRYASSFAELLKRYNPEKNTIVVGRDARLSGEMAEKLVVGALMAMGFDVVNIGLATTPTTELAVIGLKAAGGVIITASHNPKQWNALKLLGGDGEFISDEMGKEVLRIAENDDFVYAEVEDLGKEYHDDTWLSRHIDMICQLPLVDVEAIRSRQFNIAVDAINSVGGIAIPKLLKSLGVNNIIEINCEPNGKFAHNPEPIPENLYEISDFIKSNNDIDLGIVVDPDVDRLALVMENGEMFVEEYTLVSVADYVLSNRKGSAVSNLSSSRALSDICKLHGCDYYASAVGEVNVVKKMKEKIAVIGGEGNGGVIYPELHYGRDALVGVALFLTALAKSGFKMTEWKKLLPEYHISKNKINLSDNLDVDALLRKIKEHYSDEKITDIDGVKIDFKNGWVHLRKSNTEPIIRIYSEASTKEEAEDMATKVKEIIAALSNT